MDPTFPGGYRIRGAVHLQAKRHEQAIAAFERASVLSGTEDWGLAHVAVGHAAAGHEAKARELLDWLEQRQKDSYVSPYLLAIVHANFGQADAAFEWLEKGYAAKNPMLAFLRADTLLDPVRSDPRLQDLIGRMELRGGS